MRKEESITSSASGSVKEKIERFIVMLGGREISPASLCAQDTYAPERADEKAYEYNGKYYRVIEIRFSGRPFIVIECGSADELLHNVMEDADPFSSDLPDEELLNEVKYSLGIEPYPER